jgi:HSP20 family protein
MSIVRFRNNFSPAEKSFNDLFRGIFNDDFGFFLKPVNSFNAPAVNVVENKDHYKVEMAAPGFSKDDFNVKVENNLLTLSGEKKSDVNKDDEKFTLKEFSHTSFSRSFTLPESVDSSRISGEYSDGILKVFIPKKEEAKDKGAVEIKIS